MVPFERALVDDWTSSYRRSIVTFLNFLPVSDNIAAFVLQDWQETRTSLFPTPPIVSPKFPHVPWPLGVGGYDLWATKNEAVGPIVRAISFQDFQPMWSQSTNATDGRTNRRTARHTDDMRWQDRTLLYSASRGKKIGRGSDVQQSMTGRSRMLDPVSGTLWGSR